MRKSIRFTLDLLNAPVSTIEWVKAMLDEITESIDDVPECEAVLTVTDLEASHENN